MTQFTKMLFLNYNLHMQTILLMTWIIFIQTLPCSLFLKRFIHELAQVIETKLIKRGITHRKKPCLGSFAAYFSIIYIT